MAFSGASAVTIERLVDDASPEEEKGSRALQGVWTLSLSH
jgi:hypothetical protein